MSMCPVAVLYPCSFSRCAFIRVVVAIGVVAVYLLKRAGSWVRGQLISLMSQLPAAFDDGVAPYALWANSAEEASHSWETQCRGLCFNIARPGI